MHGRIAVLCSFVQALVQVPDGKEMEEYSMTPDVDETYQKKTK